MNNENVKKYKYVVALKYGENGNYTKRYEFFKNLRDENGALAFVNKELSKNNFEQTCLREIIVYRYLDFFSLNLVNFNMILLEFRFN